MLVWIILRSPHLLFHCRQQSVGNHVGQIPSEGASTISCNALLLNVTGEGQLTWEVKKAHVSGRTAHINPLTPNDRYSGRNAPLTSKRCILCIYSRNTGTECFKHGIYCPCGFGGLGVACWPLVPKFAGSNPAEALGFLERKIPQHAFLRRGSKAVGPMS